MGSKVWASGIVCADANIRLITGFWDNQELAEYALGQVLEGTEYNCLVDAFIAKAINNPLNIFVSEVQNDAANKVYTTLVDWNIDCWITYIRSSGLTAKVHEKLKRLGIEDAVLNEVDVYHN